MKVSVFGIGYVGAVVSACLAESGHEIIAVDPNKIKVDCINKGKSPIVEKGLDELIAKNVAAGKIKAISGAREAVMNSEMSLICVGTPSEEDGSLDYKYIKGICQEIGEALKDKDDYHIVVVRSTVVPGTLEQIVKPALEQASGKKAVRDFGLGNNPEFLRESTAIEDYYHPTQIVVGALDQNTAEKIMSLYDGIDAPRTLTSANVAEGVKYFSNSWGPNKISFANEVGNILKCHGVDSHEVMKIFFQDKKINMGSSFLMPGFAFGGSCLPKDIKALRVSANDKGLSTPVFDSMMKANELQIEHAFDMIKGAGKKKIALLGLSFKPGTDDLRESPLVTLADKLYKHGYDLRIYDPCVMQARNMDGANRDYIENGIPHLSWCLVESADDFTGWAELFVLGNGTKEFADILEKAPEDVSIVDLVRLNAPYEKRKSYSGICW